MPEIYLKRVFAEPHVATRFASTSPVRAESRYVSKREHAVTRRAQKFTSLTVEPGRLVPAFDAYGTAQQTALASRFDVAVQRPQIFIGVSRETYHLVEGSNLLLLELSPFFAAGPDDSPVIVVSFEHQYGSFLFIVAEHLLENGHNEPHAVYLIVPKDDVVRRKRLVLRRPIGFGVRYTSHLWLRFQEQERGSVIRQCNASSTPPSRPDRSEGRG